MSKFRRSSAVALSAFLLAWVSIPAHADSAGDWLSRMNNAVEKMNYRGILLHTYRDEVDVLQIIHRFENGQVTERTISLDGVGREIIRSNDEVTCIFPDQQMIMVEREDYGRHDTSPVVGRLPNIMVLDDANYELSMLGPGRAAGLDAEVLSVHPKDAYRYGYRLWVARDTAMLLKSQLMGEQGDVVEEFLFTSISFPDSISADEVEPSVVIDSHKWQRAEPVINRKMQLSEAGWRATERPHGFELAAVRLKTAAELNSPTEQLVYSDGLASVSVFVEVGVAASEQAEGLSQVGAANAYSTTREGHLITAVGDVPGLTAKMIALSLRPSGQ